MFERFTDAARRVVVHAQEEARLLDHGYIGTEHLLLGLCREDTEGLAAAGVLLDRARAEVEDLVGRGRGVPPNEIPFTPRAKKVLELSLREALQLGHNYIGGEHILLGMIREGEGGGAKVLERLGVSFDDLRQRILTQMRSQQKRHVFPPSGGIEARLAAIEERLEHIERLLRGRD